MGLQRLRQAPRVPAGALHLLGQGRAGQGRLPPRGEPRGAGHDRARDGLPRIRGQGRARARAVRAPHIRLPRRPALLGALVLPPRRERGDRRAQDGPAQEGEVQEAQQEEGEPPREGVLRGPRILRLHGASRGRAREHGADGLRRGGRGRPAGAAHPALRHAALPDLHPAREEGLGPCRGRARLHRVARRRAHVQEAVRPDPGGPRERVRLHRVARRRACSRNCSA